MNNCFGAETCFIHITTDWLVQRGNASNWSMKATHRHFWPLLTHQTQLIFCPEWWWYQILSNIAKDSFVHGKFPFPKWGVLVLIKVRAESHICTCIIRVKRPRLNLSWPDRLLRKQKKPCYLPWTQLIQSYSKVHLNQI